MHQKAFIAVCSAALIAGISAFFIKSIALDPLSQTWMRMTVPTVIIALWMALQKHTFFTGNWKKMLGISMLGTIRMIFFLAAYIYTSIGNAVIMFYTYPIFAAILSAVLLKELVSNRQKVLLFTAFIGIVLAFSGKEFSFGDRDFIGMGASLISALLYSYTVILFKSESNNYSPGEMVFYQNFAGAIVLLPFFDFAAATTLDYVLGMSYGLLIGIVVFSLFFYGLKHLKASTAAALMYLEIISALALGYIWKNEQLSYLMIAGGVLIIASSYLIRTDSLK